MVTRRRRGGDEWTEWALSGLVNARMASRMAMRERIQLKRRITMEQEDHPDRCSEDEHGEHPGDQRALELPKLVGIV